MMALIPMDWIAAAVAVLASMGAAWLMGKANGTLRAKNRGLQDEVDAHDRINEADLGIGASDADNQRWLRDFHTKHGK